MKTNVSPATGENNLVAYVACAGWSAGKARAAEFESCAALIEAGFKRGECKSGCCGVGDCIKVCKQGAMKLENGKVVIDADKCDGCGDCAAEGVCPQHLIHMIPKDATNFIPCSSTEEDDELVRKTCGFGCIACGECERACPEGAVHIVDNHAVIIQKNASILVIFLVIVMIQIIGIIRGLHNRVIYICIVNFEPSD